MPGARRARVEERLVHAQEQSEEEVAGSPEGKGSMRLSFGGGSAGPGPAPKKGAVPGTPARTGLGGLVSKLTQAFGVKPCGGCKDRAATLDRWTGKLRF